MGYMLDREWDTHIEMKRTACEAAASLLKPGETVFIDCGTTTTHLASRIPADSQITVVCYAMNIAEIVCKKPGVRVVAEMFPRFGSSDFSTEITRLLALRPDVILSTSWGGELVTFIRQATERRLHERSMFVLPVAEASMQILGRSMPEGHIIGTRGDHWNNHPAPKDPAAFNAFVNAYRQRKAQESG